MLHHNGGHILLGVLVTWRMIDKAVTITDDECAGKQRQLCAGGTEYRDDP
jgi:hypothetical protein